MRSLLLTTNAPTMTETVVGVEAFGISEDCLGPLDHKQEGGQETELRLVLSRQRIQIQDRCRVMALAIPRAVARAEKVQEVKS